MSNGKKRITVQVNEVIADYDPSRESDSRIICTRELTEGQIADARDALYGLMTLLDLNRPVTF